MSNQRGSYRVYTNDWTMGPDGNAVFADELAANSCRPWVALERKELALAANGKVRFPLRDFSAKPMHPQPSAGLPSWSKAWSRSSRPKGQ